LEIGLVPNLSKVQVLGVIVLAAKYLTSLNLKPPRMIAAAAAVLGVSRKAGYEAAEALEGELCGEARKAPGEEETPREVLLMRIQNQVLRYERDHGGIRFAADGTHLPEGAKSLCVRILRDFRGKLTLTEIANTIGVAASSLSRWDEEADPAFRFPPKPDLRGQHRHATPQDAQQVLTAFKSMTRDMTIEEFTDQYNGEHADSPLDRRTITRILQAAGLYTPQPRDDRKPYHGKFRVYFPGAQVAIDGTETTVRFTGEPQESITLVKEVAIDIASGAIVGDVLTTHEDAEGVKQVIVKAREECASLLAVLADNRSSNTAPEAQRAAAEQSALGTIFTFPYHACTNGHLEGHFGQFSRIVGPLEVDDTSRSTLASSIVGLVWRVWTAFHNHAPRSRLAGKSPLEYFKTYTVLPREVEEARRSLADQQRRSQESRAPHPRLADPLFRRLVARILKTHDLQDVELDHAVSSLVRYDDAVIESSSCALTAASKRDSFEDSKRTFRYFMGIVKNKQKALDRDRANAAADVLRAERLFDEDAAQRDAVDREERQEREDLKTHPESVILTYARLLMRGRFRLLRERCLERIREGLSSLRRLGRASSSALDSLAAAIRTLPDFAEDIKDHMVRLLSEEFQQGP
jgi:hypothetical protein